MRTFVYSAHPSRIVFGTGTVEVVAAEVERLGGTKALVLAGPRGGAAAGAVTGALGPLAVGRFDGA
ncbi:MAG TPA: alcohol dehydrogenase, partial [Pseudonocardiaceae bacterium]|nr:alcohol dehydrogenase [Pseudonocardiaceae bacterium]